MDLSDLFKKHLARGVHMTKTLQDRKQELLKDRKSKRETLTFARRNIDVNMSLYKTPIADHMAPIKEQKREPPKTHNEGGRKRFELLLKWKAEKDKRKQLEKANKKPIFKVCHIDTDLAVNLENVNKLIKGKVIPSSAKKSQFAPLNHKFRPPNGIKPINFTTFSAQNKVPENSSKNMTPILGLSKVKLQCKRDNSKNHKTSVEMPPKQPIRSSTRIKEKNSLIKSVSTAGANEIKKSKGKSSSFSTPKPSLPKSISTKQTSKRVSNRQQAKNKEDSRKIPTKIARSKTEKDIDVNVNNNKDPAEAKLTPIENSTKTPKRISSSSKSSCLIKLFTDIDLDAKPEARHTPVYISPFVTISRGKQNAREEHRVRHSDCKEDLKSLTSEKVDVFTRYTSPQAGAGYFMVKLDSEIDRLNKMCQQWKDYRQDSELPEESCSSIDVAIGQCNLLITKKFEQFRRLIVQCKTKQYEEKTITCEDLHGFWDMIYMQVEDLNTRFANLERLRANNWTEIMPEKKAPAKKAKMRSKQPRASSRLKDMIKAAREKQKNIIGDCEEQSIMSSTTDKKNNIRLSVLQEKRCSSSPGLTIMKVSQSIKQGNGLTPAKSILKVDNSRSTRKKSVAFSEASSSQGFRETLLFDEDDKENTPRRLRRSSKLIKTSA